MYLYHGVAWKADSQNSLCDGTGEKAPWIKCCVQAQGPEFDVLEPMFKRGGGGVKACPGGAETGRCLGLSEQPI